MGIRAIVVLLGVFLSFVRLVGFSVLRL